MLLEISKPCSTQKSKIELELLIFGTTCLFSLAHGKTNSEPPKILPMHLRV